MMKSFLLFLSDFVFFYPLLMSFVWMAGSIIFYWKHERKVKKPPELERYPMFSILVPAHNESEQIEKTISQLLGLDYPEYEIIAIDDGSADDTAKIIKRMCETFSIVRGVYLKENTGKAAALNAACAVSNGEIILTLDADALLDSDALKWMAVHFVHFPRVGAVTGNPRVLNRTSLLAKIQTGEYSTIIGMIKRAQRIWGKIMTISGVVVAFRKSALYSVGFWDKGMVTEDIAVTWKLEREFWDIRFEPRAVAWILVPETIKGLFQQRLRWARGGIEVLVKNHDIWQYWEQRRLWPVFTEYMVSICWAYAFWLLIALWAVQGIASGFMPVHFNPPLPPLWTGSILALVCLLMFCVGIALESEYDRKILRYLFWVIWYPFLYWIINVSTIPFAVPKALFGKRESVWESPDRGIRIRQRKDTAI